MSPQLAALGAAFGVLAVRFAQEHPDQIASLLRGEPDQEARDMAFMLSMHLHELLMTLTAESAADPARLAAAQSASQALRQYADWLEASGR